MSELLTVDDAAALAHCRPRTVQRAIRAGELAALFGGRYLLEREAVLGWMRRRGEDRVARPQVPRRASRAARPQDGRVGSVHRLKAIRGEEG